MQVHFNPFHISQVAQNGDGHSSTLLHTKHIIGGSVI